MITTPSIKPKNCINCDTYFKCKDPSKSILFVCSRYKKTSQANEKNEIAFFEDSLGVSIAPRASQILSVYSPEEERSLRSESYNMLEALTKENRIVSPDVRIPEGDFPEAPNFYTWCVSDKYLNMKPFVEQALMGTELLTEWCPRCSDVDWMKNRHSVGDSLHKFERRVALLEHGKCPHCGLTRAKAIRKGLLKPYYELAACCGQRCVGAHTMVLTEDGLVEIGEYAEDGRDVGFTPFNRFVHNGTRMEETSDFYITEVEEKLLLLRLTDGTELAGTCDHPVVTSDGLKKLSVISEDDWVCIRVGQNVFGNKSFYPDTTAVSADDLKSLLNQIGPDELSHNQAVSERVAFKAGQWVGTGRGPELSSLLKVLGEDLTTFDSRSVIPKFVRKGTRAMQVSYLRGLFDVSGSVVGCQFVALTVSMYRLCSQLSAMLKNFGMKHKVLRYPDTSCWTLALTGDAIAQFAHVVGFLNADKQKRLLDLAKFSACASTPLFYEHFSPLLQTRIEAFADNLPKPFVFHAGVYKRTLKQMLDFADRQDLSDSLRAELVYLGSLLDKNIYFVKVKSVTEKKNAERAYDFTLPDTHHFISNGILSHNSGKSAFFGMISSYHTHRVIKMERPNEVYRLLKSNILQGTFVALTFAQAKDTLWDPFYGNVLESPWFCSYHEMLDSYGSKYGEDLYNIKATFLLYKHRRLYLYPAGPDLRVLRGKTRFLAGIDELGLFPNDASAMKNIKMNAHEVYTSLENSLATVRQASTLCLESGFYNVPQALFINISSPFSVRDKIMELVRKSQNSSGILGWHKATWEMNPTLPLSCQYLTNKFRDDPIGAMRDFGAKPPLTNNGFITNRDYVTSNYSGKSNSLRLRYEYTVSSDKKSKELYASVDYIKDSGRRSVLALDGGHTNNSFAFAVGHIDPHRYPHISLVGEIIPEPGVPINYSRAYTDFLLPIIAHRNVVIARADRWNSLKILSDMERDTGLQKSVYSLRYEDMQLFKAYLADNQMSIPTPKKSIEEILAYDPAEYPRCFRSHPEEHMVLQMLTVQDTGSQVIKGDGLTDDILRAMMLCFITLVDEDIQQELLGPDKETSVADNAQSRMFIKTYSGGSGSSNVPGGAGSSNLGVLRSRT